MKKYRMTIVANGVGGKVSHRMLKSVSGWDAENRVWRTIKRSGDARMRRRYFLCEANADGSWWCTTMWHYNDIKGGMIVTAYPTTAWKAVAV